MNGKTTRISPRTGVIFAAALIAVMTTSALAQTPTENTRIGNQASATYENALGDSFTVTSNLVETVVQEVLGVDIAPAALGQNANPGSTVSYGHTITNTGNGSEAFDLSYSEAGPFTCDPPGPQAFADMSPQDGVPDNPAAPITQTPALGAGASYSIVVTCTIPATATAGQSHALTITAAAASDGAVNDIAVDTTTVTNDAVINITKAFVPAVAVADGSTQYEVRLSYRNDGNTTSNRVVITDDLDARLSYVGGSGLWSGSATPLSDAAGASPPDTDPAGIEYEYNGGTARVTAILDSVAPGQSGTITFRVTVPVGTAAGPIPNVANYQYDEDADGTVDQVAPGFSTNTANLTVSNAPSVTFVGETIAAANQGDAVTFTNVLTNTGNATDTFDITLDTSSFGAGVSFTLYQGDGVTPLVDTNGNSIPDTGPVAAGGTYNVVLVVQLDPSATGGPYSVDKIATSANDPGVSATATDTLTNISGSVVDLTNDSTFNAGTPAPGQGVNPTGEASPVNTNSATGGSTTSFTLFVNNRSAVTDSYNLAASTDNTFATISLPAG